MMLPDRVHDHRNWCSRSTGIRVHDPPEYAPFLYFDNAPVFGCFNGVVRIMLEAVRTMPTPGQTVSTDRVIVAHLRMSIPAALALKAAIEGALLLATPAAGASGDAPKPN